MCGDWSLGARRDVFRVWRFLCEVVRVVGVGLGCIVILAAISYFSLWVGNVQTPPIWLT